MNSILIATTRDLISRCRWNFLVCSSMATLLPLSVFGVMRAQGLPLDDHNLRVLMHRMITMCSIACATSLIDHHPFSNRQFLAPVSSLKLFVALLVPQMLIAGLLTWLSATLLNWFTLVDFPAGTSACFASCCVAVCWSTYWMTHESPWRPLVLLAIVGGFLSWYVARLCWFEGDRMTELSFLEWMGFILLTGLISCIGYESFARCRYGESLVALPSRRHSKHLSHAPAIRLKRFSSPLAAQLWFEWRSKGWTLPLFVATGVVAGLSVAIVRAWIIRRTDMSDLFQGFVVCGLLLPFLGGLLGAFALGNFGFSWTNTSSQTSDFEMGHFLASRPLTNKTMAYANLLSVGKSVLIGWCVWLIPVATLYCVNSNLGFSTATLVAWWYLPLTLLLLWTPTAVSASIGLTGEMQRIAQLLLAVTLSSSAAILLSNWLLTFDSRVRLYHLLLIAGGIVGVLSSYWMFKWAYRQKLISEVTAYHCGWVWIALSAIILFERSRNPTWPTSINILLIGVAALAVAPMATAPLAIGRNRTR